MICFQTDFGASFRRRRIWCILNLLFISAVGCSTEVTKVLNEKLSVEILENGFGMHL